MDGGGTGVRKWMGKGEWSGVAGQRKGRENGNWGNK